MLCVLADCYFIRLLKCGNHRCLAKCHPGECRECVLLPHNVLTCPCGSTDLLFLGMPRESCLDPIACCSKVCGKKLHCGVHTCSKTCHEGKCPPCNKKVAVKCRCGAQESQFDCVKVTPPIGEGEEGEQHEPFSFECERMCNELRVCGRHRCTIKCCPSRQGADAVNAHICQIPCNKTLKCGVHRCKVINLLLFLPLSLNCHLEVSKVGDDRFCCIYAHKIVLSHRCDHKKYL